MKDWNRIISRFKLPVQSDYFQLIEFISTIFAIKSDDIDYMMDRNYGGQMAPGIGIVRDDLSFCLIWQSNEWYLFVISKNPVIFFNQELDKYFNFRDRNFGPLVGNSYIFTKCAHSYFSNKRNFCLNVKSLLLMKGILLRLANQRDLQFPPLEIH